MDLWPVDDCAKWRAAWSSYPVVIVAQRVKGLADLDQWYRADLPKLLQARKRPFVSLAELARVTNWKMKRGVWRERNRQLVLGNPPELVKQASRDAFEAIPDPRIPIATLSELEGVGPATASAVLAAYRPDLYPFFDELVANQVPELGPVKFTITYYLRYAEKLRERAERLAKTCKEERWTAHDVGQALWASSGGRTR